jgi:hypothetical protein
MTAPILSFPSRLAQLESEASYHHTEALSHWREFQAKLEEIKASELWEADYKRWADYLKQKWDISDSKFRMDRQAAEIVDLLGLEITKQEARKFGISLREIVPDASIHGAVVDFAKRLEPDKPVPSITALRSAYETIQDLRVTGSVKIEGENVNAADLLMTNGAIEHYRETLDRQRNHIADKAKPSVKLTIDCNFEVREAIKYALPKGAILPELGTQITILWRKDSE